MAETRGEDWLGEIAGLVAEVCRADPATAASADPDAPLVGPGSPLDLDSLDAVEIVVAVQKRYGVLIGAEDNPRAVLRSLRTLAAFVEARAP